MSYWKKLSLGQACAHVVGFGVVSTVLGGLLGGRSPEAIAGLVAGGGFAVLLLMVFREPDPPTRSRLVTAVTVAATTLATSLAAAAAASWLV